MKKNVLFIYRGQVLLDEFLPEYEKHIAQNCVLLVEKGFRFNLVNIAIKRLKLSVELKTIDDLLENNINMKFDHIVMNPPYKSGLHIKLFNRAFNLLKGEGVVTCIHPSTLIINRKEKRLTKEEVKFLDIIKEYKTKIKLINGNEIFNAKYYTPLSITEVKKVVCTNIDVCYSYLNNEENNYRSYDTIDKIFIHGSDLAYSIKQKIDTIIETSLNDNLHRNGARGNWYVTINRISGNKPKNGKLNPDFFQLIYKKDEIDYSRVISNTPKVARYDGNQINELAVNTEEQSINAHSYLLTKFARFCNSLYKTGPDILAELKGIPMMDFSQEWTDEKLFNYFELTQEERDFILTYIPNWYDRDFK